MPKSIYSNLVPKDKMREVQGKTLKIIRGALENCFGPYASNSIISNENAMTAKYTKDGHTILSSFKFYSIIEETVKRDLVNITEFIAKTVGDGTTSAVILSEIIFRALNELEDNKYMPYELIENFKDAVNNIKEDIRKHTQEFNPEKAYQIAFTSTNGNKEVAEQIKGLYEKFGNDLFIQISTSMNGESMIKEYDGLTIDSGYTEKCFINNENGTSKIRNPRIYLFRDPVDTPEMISFLYAIIQHNIFEPLNRLNQGDKKAAFIPTVIVAPKISRDADPIMSKLARLLYSIKDANYRPPVLVITNMLQQQQISDIGVLCGCKTIAKYINPDTQKKDIEKGIAPSLKTVPTFYGSCDIIEADISTTKVINPKNMFITKKDKDGNAVREYSTEYNSLLDFRKASLKNAIESQATIDTIAELKKSLHSLQANMIEYFVGGVGFEDRESLKDLIEDAVHNCRSAAQSGVGYGANFEGLRASSRLYNKETNETKKQFYGIILKAYKELVTCLYSSGMDKETLIEYAKKSPAYNEITDSNIEKETGLSVAITESLFNQSPYNLRTKEFDGKVLSSIETDIVILDAISKIITLMITSNQFFTPSPTTNIYCVAGQEN